MNPTELPAIADAKLEPETVDRWSTLHVRCGTNFLLIVMLLTVLIYTAFGSRGILAGILFRVVAIPVIAGISYEMLRLGAKFTRSRLMRALMAPGLWLQKITTKPPDLSQIQVAIAAFEEVLRRDPARDEDRDNGDDPDRLQQARPGRAWHGARQAVGIGQLRRVSHRGHSPRPT